MKQRGNSTTPHYASSTTLQIVGAAERNGINSELLECLRNASSIPKVYKEKHRRELHYEEEKIAALKICSYDIKSLEKLLCEKPSPKYINTYNVLDCISGSCWTSVWCALILHVLQLWRALGKSELQWLISPYLSVIQATSDSNDAPEKGIMEMLVT